MTAKNTRSRGESVRLGRHQAHNGMSMEDALLNLDIYKIAHDLVFRIHAMSLKLPPFELFEEGGQIRRSSKRISANLVEGMGVRKYKGHFLFYLYRALGSSDETQEHLKILHGTGSLKDPEQFKSLFEAYSELSKKLFSFIHTVELRHESPRYLKESPDGPRLPSPDDSDPPF